MPAGRRDDPARSSRDAELLRARRDFIRTHHPDRGGDPATFIDGLRRFDAPDSRAQGSPDGDRPGGAPRVTVLHRPRGPSGWTRHLARLLLTTTRRSRRPPRVR